MLFCNANSLTLAFSFLAKLEEAKSAASLFESARHWKAGDAALQRLKPQITQMTCVLDVPYARLLAKCASAAEAVRTIAPLYINVRVIVPRLLPSRQSA